jgi:hypothetical protein
MRYRTESLTPAVCLMAGMLTLASAFSHPAGGQTQAPTKAQTRPGAGAYNYLFRASVACGAGSTHADAVTKPTAQCGAMFTLPPPLELEAGVMGPLAHHPNPSAYLSLNGVAPLGNMGNRFGAPVAVGGYTQIFGTGHTLDYGVGFMHPVDSTHSVQFEARDYWTLEHPDQHHVVFRVVWMVGLPD